MCPPARTPIPPRPPSSPEANMNFRFRSGLAGDLTRYGAASGIASGAAASTNEQLVARYGPNKIVDRCMAGRGYAVLNDVGAGTN
jgi:hypothetical protein